MGDRHQREAVYDAAARRAARAPKQWQRILGVGVVGGVSGTIESYFLIFWLAPAVVAAVEFYVSAKQAGATRITGIALGVLLLAATFLRVRRSQSRWRRAAIAVVGCVALFVVALVVAVVGGRDI